MTKRIDCIKSSAIRKIMDKASQLDNVINFSIGQPDFGVPEYIKNSIKESLNNDQTSYTPSAGITSLRNKITNKHNTEDAIVTSGVTAAIFLTYSALLEEGDELIILQPHFVVYPDLCKCLNANPVIVPTTNDFSPDINAIKQAITSKTKAILINHPNNPTGTIYDKQILQEIADLAGKNNLWIISDEVYETFDYENKFHSMKEFYDKCIILNGFSKNFAMTGLRVGYATGPKEVIQDMIKLQQYTFVCAPSIAQHAVDNNFNAENKAVQDFKKRRDFIYQELKDSFNTIKPEGAFYYFLQLPEKITGEEFAEKCLEKKLLVVPGEAFSTEKNYIRISYATDFESIKRGVKLLKETLEELKNGT